MTPESMLQEMIEEQSTFVDEAILRLDDLRRALDILQEVNKRIEAESNLIDEWLDDLIVMAEAV